MSLEQKLVDEITKAFSAFDVDGNGTISLPEMEEVLKSLGMFESSWTTKVMFEQVDQDGSGEIEFDEFVELYKQFSNMNNSGTSNSTQTSIQKSDSKPKKWATIDTTDKMQKTPVSKSNLVPINKKEFVKRKLVKTDTSLLPREVSFGCFSEEGKKYCHFENKSGSKY